MLSLAKTNGSQSVKAHEDVSILSTIQNSFFVSLGKSCGKHFLITDDCIIIMFRF